MPAGGWGPSRRTVRGGGRGGGCDGSDRGPIDYTPGRHDPRHRQSDYRGGRPALAIAADLAKREDVERLVGEAEAALGGVDILVNNGAVTYFTPIMEFSPKRRQLMFEVQVSAPMDLAQMVIPGMIQAGEGWIVNISWVRPAIPSSRQSWAPAEARCTECARPRWSGSRPASLRSPKCTRPTWRSTPSRPTGSCQHPARSTTIWSVRTAPLRRSGTAGSCSPRPRWPFAQWNQRSEPAWLPYSQDLRKELGPEAPSYVVAQVDPLCGPGQRARYGGR